MEDGRSPMFMDPKNEYCEDGHPTRSNLQILCISVKVLGLFFTDRREKKKVLKFTQKYKRLKLAKAIVSKDSTAGNPTRPDFNLHYRATVANRAGEWPQNRCTDQWNGIEGSEMPKHPREKRQHPQQVAPWCWIINMKKETQFLSPTLHKTKLNSHQVKDINVRHDTLKLPEEKVGSVLPYTGTARTLWTKWF